MADRVLKPHCDVFCMVHNETPGSLCWFVYLSTEASHSFINHTRLSMQNYLWVTSVLL